MAHLKKTARAAMLWLLLCAFAQPAAAAEAEDWAGKLAGNWAVTHEEYVFLKNGALERQGVHDERTDETDLFVFGGNGYFATRVINYAVGHANYAQYQAWALQELEEGAFVWQGEEALWAGRLTLTARGKPDRQLVVIFQDADTMAIQDWKQDVYGETVIDGYQLYHFTRAQRQ